jgi:glucose/arabinose dehydrogenase/mono/diheme cytochrome c family protein
MKKRHLLVTFLALMALGGSARVFAAGKAVAPAKESPATVVSPVIDYLSPQDEAKTFFLQPGYELQLVVSDPIIKEPVLTVFDGNGRMFVAEMRSYMQDVNGSNQRAKNSRVSVHWSSKHNGVYDKHAIFADNLVLPRMVLPLANGVVINETDSDDFYLYTDTKGDGVADKKTMFFSGGQRGGNLEHQASGLIWDIDNYLYMAMNPYRLRVQGKNVVRENISINGGQWGTTQDNYGKQWFVNAGAESGPLYYQTPSQYGYYSVSGESPPDFPEVYPLIGLADVQGGTVRFRPEQKSLNHFTATCGGEIYRGDRLPADLRGDFFFAEPVGRLIRRAKVEVRDGISYLSNAYDKSEFIRSTDPDFRPVNLANAPDGTLYITDMYRGIIQERDWVGAGSYLRGVVEKFHLEKNIGRGRIWRVVYKGIKPGPQPEMLREKPAKLVSYLAHPNGWWRDTAQKLIVLGGDKLVVPALQEMARSNPNPLARIHAIWTLDGLDAFDAAFLREKLQDTNAEVRVAAIRASERLYQKGDHSIPAIVEPCGKDADPNVILQVLESASFVKWPDWQTFLTATINASSSKGVKDIGSQLGGGAYRSPSAPAFAAPVPPPSRFTPEEKRILERGEIIYKQLCFACHAQNGRGTPFQGAAAGATLAPPLSGSKTATGYGDGIISVVLKGLSGPVEGKNYSAQMVPMESNDDDWIAAVISYVRNNFGNHSTFITPADVARVRSAIQAHTNAWTLDELGDTLPQPMRNRHQWKLTSNYSAASLPLAIDGNLATGFNTRIPQRPGMWVQIELPEAAEIAGVELDAGTAIQNYPRSYKIELADDGINWKTIATGHSSAVRNQILFPPTTATFIRIMQTGLDPGYSWCINELNLLKMLSAEELLQPPELFPLLDGAVSVTDQPANPPPPQTHERTPFTVE